VEGGHLLSKHVLYSSKFCTSLTSSRCYAIATESSHIILQALRGTDVNTCFTYIGTNVHFFDWNHIRRIKSSEISTVSYEYF